MKIAILFSGRIHKYGNHFNNIIDKLVKDNEVGFFLSHTPELKEDIELFSELYCPIAVSNDPIELFDYSKYPYPENVMPYNVLCMHYNRKRVFNLLKEHCKNTGTHYDVVISHRTDVFCFNDLDLNIVNNGLCIPDDKNGLGMNDQFALGTMVTMEPYMNVYDTILQSLDAGCIFNAEALLDAALNGIQVYRFPFKTAIIRDTEYSNHL
jgi:hypothetical protein